MGNWIWIIVGIVVLFVFALILRRFLVVRSEKKMESFIEKYPAIFTGSIRRYDENGSYRDGKTSIISDMALLYIQSIKEQNDLIEIQIKKHHCANRNECESEENEKKCEDCVFLRSAYDLNTDNFMFHYCGFSKENDDIYNTVNPSTLPSYKAVYCNAKCDNRCTKDDARCFVKHFADQRVEEDCNNYREIAPIVNLNISVKEGDTRET